MNREIQLELTLKCPFNCIHCSGSAFLGHKHIYLIIIKNRINKLRKLFNNINELVLTGGEPLLRKDLADIIKLSKKISKKVTLFTTGNPRIVKWQEFKELGLNKVVFSIHSINKDINDYFFQDKALDTTLKSMENAQIAGLNTEVNCVLTKKNFSTIDKTIKELISKHKVKRVRLLRFVNQGRAKDNNESLSLDPEILNNIIKKLMNKYKELVHPEGFPSLHRCRSNQEIGPGCQFGSGFLYIDTQGNILPCPAVKRNPRTIIGNIDEINSLEDFNKRSMNIQESISKENDEFECLSQASWLEK